MRNSLVSKLLYRSIRKRLRVAKGLAISRSRVSSGTCLGNQSNDDILAGQEVFVHDIFCAVHKTTRDAQWASSTWPMSKSAMLNSRRSEERTEFAARSLRFAVETVVTRFTVLSYGIGKLMVVAMACYLQTAPCKSLPL